MNYCNNEKEDIKKFTAELKKIKNSQPVSVKLRELAVFAMITHIQLASRHPNATSEFTVIAILAAKQLQETLKNYPVIYQILEMGWNSEHDRPVEKT